MPAGERKRLETAAEPSPEKPPLELVTTVDNLPFESFIILFKLTHEI